MRDVLASQNIFQKWQDIIRSFRATERDQQNRIKLGLVGHNWGFGERDVRQSLVVFFLAVSAQAARLFCSISNAKPEGLRPYRYKVVAFSERLDSKY